VKRVHVTEGCITFHTTDRYQVGNLTFAGVLGIINIDSLPRY